MTKEQLEFLQKCLIQQENYREGIAILKAMAEQCPTAARRKVINQGLATVRKKLARLDRFIETKASPACVARIREMKKPSLD